jgi:hypothetical protein
MKIVLITEGTYPFAFGGVSVWCDQLIRGMAACDFHLIALVATDAETPVWPLPDNVVSMRKVPLWGPVPLPAVRRRDRPPQRVLRELVDVLLGPPAHTGSRFVGVLRELHEFSLRAGNQRICLAGDEAVRLLAGAWRDRWPADGPPPPTLHDAVTALQLLEHSLRPLCIAPVAAHLAHTVANGLGLLPALAAKWQYRTPILLT